MACTMTRGPRVGLLGRQSPPRAPQAGAFSSGSSHRALLQRSLPARRPLPVLASSSSGASSSVAAADVAAPLGTLREACQTKQVPPEEVCKAMDQLEAAHAQSSLVEGFPAVLDGTWRLVFASPGPPLIKAWQYIPVIEDAEIDLSAGTISLVGYLGPLCNRFKGRCRFESDPATGAYKMVFGWSELETTFFSFRSVKELGYKEKTYSFFLLQGNLAASNSSGTGGKTLMFRVPKK